MNLCILSRFRVSAPSLLMICSVFFACGQDVSLGTHDDSFGENEMIVPAGGPKNVLTEGSGGLRVNEGGITGGMSANDDTAGHSQVSGREEDIETANPESQGDGTGMGGHSSSTSEGGLDDKSSLEEEDSGDEENEDDEDRQEEEEDDERD